MELRPHIDPDTLDLRLPGYDRFTGEQWRNMTFPPCPRCGRTVNATRLDVTYYEERVRHYMFGRWECPDECDPRRTNA